MLGIKGGFSHIVPPDARPTCKEGTAASCADWVDPDAPIALAIETEACNHRILSYCDSGHEQYKKFFWIEHRIGDKYTGLTSGSAVFVYSASYQYEYSMVTSPTALHYTGREGSVWLLPSLDPAPPHPTRTRAAWVDPPWLAPSSLASARRAARCTRAMRLFSTSRTSGELRPAPASRCERCSRLSATFSVSSWLCLRLGPSDGAWSRRARLHGCHHLQRRQAAEPATAAATAAVYRSPATAADGMLVRQPSFDSSVRGVSSHFLVRAGARMTATTTGIPGRATDIATTASCSRDITGGLWGTDIRRALAEISPPPIYRGTERQAGRLAESRQDAAG